MRPVLDAWAQMIAVAQAAGLPVIYTTPVSRSDGADVVMLPTDLSAETGVLPRCRGHGRGRLVMHDAVLARSGRSGQSVSPSSRSLVRRPARRTDARAYRCWRMS